MSKSWKYISKKNSSRGMIALFCMTVMFVCGVVYTNASEPVRSIVIEEGVTEIGKYEYFSKYGLENVQFPSTLQKIGFSAFDNCTSLKQIQLPEGLTTIDNRGFAKCESLTKVTVPSTVTTLGNAAFYGCSSLTQVTLPQNLKRIENNLFYRCSALSSVEIPESVTEIGQQSFYDCSALTDITLPDQLLKIEDGAFYNCESLAEITIPDSVTSIGKDAFSGCKNLVISCNAGSYAESYAKENGITIQTKEAETAQTASEGTEQTLVNQEGTQVPETGVELPYLLCLIALTVAGAIFIYQRRMEKRETFPKGR